MLVAAVVTVLMGIGFGQVCDRLAKCRDPVSGWLWMALARVLWVALAVIALGWVVYAAGL